VGVASSPKSVTITNPTNQPLNVSSVSFPGGSSTFQLATDSCSGTTVPAGGSCSVAVSFTPPFPYLFTATMSIATNAPKPSMSVSMRGEGTSPTFTISTSAIHFGSLRAKSSSPPQAVTVTNTSAGPLTFFFLQTNLAIAHSGCTSQLAAGDSCTLQITTTPSGNGPDSGLVKVVDQSFNQQVVEADWSGIGGFANIVSTVGGTNLALRVGDSVSGYAIVYDTGTDILSLGQVALSANPAVAVTSDGCSNQTLAIGARCLIGLTIHPTVAGTWSATLSIPTDDPVDPSPSTIAFGGMASPPSQPVFFPSSVVFPAQRVGSEATQIVWLDDGVGLQLGRLPLKISSAGIGGHDASSFRVVWDGCTGLTVGPEFSCPVEVAFDPKARGGLTGSLVVTDDGQGSHQAVPLGGTGLAPAITLTPSALNFGGVVVRAKSNALTLTVASTGDLPLNISGEMISGPNKGEFTITSETCRNQTLAPSATCQVTIVFRPEAAGQRSATLTLDDNAIDSPQPIPLTGTGTGK